jgi:hypothetical protein
LSALALEEWYVVDSANESNLLSTSDTRRSTCKAHLMRLHTVQGEPIIHPVSQEIYHLRDTQVHEVCRSLKSPSPRDASVRFGIPNCGQLFRGQIDENWGAEVVDSYSDMIRMYSLTVY